MKSTLTSENKKTNKTVIRKETIKGEFTTVQHSILLDTRITANAFRLFTAILSDSDTKFELSQSLYCKRLNIPYTTFKDSISNLIECGYIERIDINKDKPTSKVIYHYTLSEFGNLRAETEKKMKATKTSTSTKSKVQDVKPVEIKIEDKSPSIPVEEIASDAITTESKVENIKGGSKRFDKARIKLIIKEKVLDATPREVQKINSVVYKWYTELMKKHWLLPTKKEIETKAIDTFYKIKSESSSVIKDDSKGKSSLPVDESLTAELSEFELLLLKDKERQAEQERAKIEAIKKAEQKAREEDPNGLLSELKKSYLNMRQMYIIEKEIKAGKIIDIHQLNLAVNEAKSA